MISTAVYRASSVFAADLDGDDDLDVLSASFGDDKIAWYENHIAWEDFGPQQVISTEAVAAHSVFAADVDGDGDPDVFSASFGDDKIAWYENLGEPQDVPASTKWGSILIAVLLLASTAIILSRR